MSSVASWADEYRYTTPGKFSAPLHYIGKPGGDMRGQRRARVLMNGFVDAEDGPPDTCSVNLSRDCGAGGCIVSAIANYVRDYSPKDTEISNPRDLPTHQTQRVNDQQYSIADRKQALEFLIHFLGDITQPLHTEAIKVGGNQIPVLWQGNITNLHATWDTQMVEKDAGGYGAAVITSYSQRLIAAIDHGAYASQKKSWVACTNVKTASKCALSWARDANGINCAYVLKVDETDRELDGAYYEGAKPYIEMQIAKGGFRLGTWVNKLAAAAAAAAKKGEREGLGIVQQ
ncbi:MAG: hypothetical protein Q9168_000963 [Polycauliona sp. 1 TL-2023]